MKKILFIQSKFDFDQFYDTNIFPNPDSIEFEGIKYINKEIKLGQQIFWLRNKIWVL